MGFLIYLTFCILVFWVYYFLKKKCLTKNTSCATRMPLIISCIHFLLGVCFSLFLILFLRLNFSFLPIALILSIVKIIGFYTILAVPVSIGTIVISIGYYHH